MSFRNLYIYNVCYVHDKYLQKIVDSALLLRVLEIRLRSTIAGLLLIHRCCHELFKHTRTWSLAAASYVLNTNI